MAGTFALIVAAGRGTRFGAPLPKQYQQVAGRAVLGHAVAAFAGHPLVAGVRVVIHPDDRAHFEAATAGQDVGEPLAGGATRQDSVRLGLEGLAAAAPDRVLIHDAARPCVAPDLIGRVVAALDAHGAVIPALPVVDALKRATNALVTDAVDRTGLVRAQTPQGFRYDAILAAHRSLAGHDLPDDAAVAAAAGHAVALVAGDEDNLKVTTAADLDRVARALAPAFPDVRTGTGFDVHRFGPGDHVMLGGIRVPHDHGLVGHSDADVVLHALVDALLGTVGAGDIGVHFPPTDARWRGADSALFVEEARRLVAEARGRIANVDVTIVGERPRVGPHRAAIRARISALLGIEEARVNVKATTTEGLGFTGRSEGLACQATATVSFGARP